jgi:flavin reductase (DIM6/NTAB) family NADH-FMN oxidoreductase RutF
MLINYEELNNKTRYHIISQTVSPRPIAWIITEDEGVINAAAFSYFTPLSSDPATILVSIGHKANGEPKDTLANILKTKKATICLVQEEDIANVKLTSQSFDKNISEVSKFNISTKQVFDGFPPMIATANNALFCELYEKIELPGKTVPLILQIKAQFVKDDLINEAHDIDIDNIGRVGAFYTKTLKEDL